MAWRLAGHQPERVATLTAVSTPHPRALARALVAATQAWRSAYIPVFRLPRLPELLLGAHRQWGCAGCWLPEHHAQELGPLLLEHLRRGNTRPADAGGPAR